MTKLVVLPEKDAATTLVSTTDPAEIAKVLGGVGGVSWGGGGAGAGRWVPPGPRHWFDMGTNPSFVAIRFFREPEGWVGSFTGDDIATRYPAFDDLIAPVAG